MKHIKKFILLFMLIVTCSIITGCEEEASVINNPTNIDANNGKLYDLRSHKNKKGIKYNG